MQNIILPGQPAFSTTPNAPLGATLAVAQQAPQSFAEQASLDQFVPQATNGVDVANTRFFVEYINIQETPQYVDHFNRHYVPAAQTETQFTNAISDLLLDVARNKGNAGTATIAPHASNIFSLNMAAGIDNQTFIPGGWGSKRAKFLMLVREEDQQFKKTRITYINGFTDHFGVTTSNGRTAIDPRMTFFINSLVTLSQERHQTPQGVQTYWNVVQASQVVDGQLVGVDVRTNSVNDVFMMRPSDMISRYSEQSDYELGVTNWMTHNGQNSTLGGVVSHFNNMSNNIPSTYLSRLLDPVLKGATGLSPRPGLGGMASSMFEVANRSEFTLANCPFLRYMSRSLGMPLSTRFTLDQISRMDATIGQRTMHFPIDPNSYMNINAMSLDSTPWNYAGIETEVASKLIAVIPSLLWENFAQSASFTFTNATPGHMPVISWDLLQFITPTGMPGFHQKLENALLNVVLPDISRANQLILKVSVFVDVSGEIRMSISYDGGQEMHYTSPAFGCGILNPIHTNNAKMAGSLVNGFGQIVDGVVALRQESRGTSDSALNLNF